MLRVTSSLCVLYVAGAFGQKPDVGWKNYLGGPESAHYSPLKQINKSNVSKIEVAWTYPAGDGPSTFCPLVVDNIAYVSAKGGALVALDATTGKELWMHWFGTRGGRGGIAGQRGAKLLGKQRPQRPAHLSPRRVICTPSMRSRESLWTRSLITESWI